MGIIEAIVGIVVASSIGAIGGGTIGLSLVGQTILTGVIYGGAALSRSLASKKEAHTNSPTYQFNTLQTQTNNQLPIPLIYGENKIAGNRLWQQYRDNNTIIDRIVAFGEGQVESIEDIRLNDIPLEELQGVDYRLYTGTNEQLTDSIVANTLEERISTVGSLKNIAYIALSVKAGEKIRGDYNLTTIVKGRRVRVYSSQDNYQIIYCNNPAWCLLDFLTAYNGCGIGLSSEGARDDEKIKEFIDIDSFIEAATFCDETVEDLPRFSFNMIIDSQSQRQDILEEFKKSCRGALTLKGKRLQLKIDTDVAACKTILAKDIIAGTEQFSTLPKDENYDRIIIKYRSKTQEWAICEAIAEKETFDNIPPIEHTVSIYSVTEHNQASRLAWYYLNKVAQERYFGYFETDYRAFGLEIGDVINLNDNLMKFSNKPVKITKLIDKNNGTFGVSWREHCQEVYSDTKGSIEPVVALCAIQNDYLTPADIEGFCATQILNAINLSWTRLFGADITYEIRLGENWDSGKVICTNLASNSILLPVTSVGLKKFFIKAKSKYNFYSQNATPSIAYVEVIPSINTVVSNDIFSTQLGEKSGVRIYNNAIKSLPQGVWANQMPKNPQYPYVDNKNKWGQFIAAEEFCYTTPIFDLKEILTSLISLNYDFNSQNPNQKLSIQVRFSTNGAFWLPWQPFSEGSFEFRFYQLKFNIVNPEKAPFYLNKTILSVDVPDRDEYYKDIPVTDAVNGVTIDFATHEQSKISKDFFCIPSIVANISGSQVGYCVITQKSLKSFTVKAFSSTNTPITASCDIHAKGY